METRSSSSINPAVLQGNITTGNVKKKETSIDTTDKFQPSMKKTDAGNVGLGEAAGILLNTANSSVKMGDRIISPPVMANDGSLLLRTKGSICSISVENGRVEVKNRKQVDLLSKSTLTPDGTVYSVDFATKAFAVDGNTGKQKWELITNELMCFEPVPGKNEIIQGIGRDKLCSLDKKTGEKKWEIHLDRMLFHTPTVGEDGTIYITPCDNKLYALDPDTGKEKWSLQFDQTIKTGATIGKDNMLYVTDSDSCMHAIDGNTGKEKWKGGDLYHGLYNPVVTDDGSLLFKAMNKDVFSLDGKTGKELWRMKLPDTLNSRLVPGPNGFVYGVTRLGKFIAMNGKENKVVWEYQMERCNPTYITPGKNGTFYVSIHDEVKVIRHLMPSDGNNEGETNNANSAGQKDDSLTIKNEGSFVVIGGVKLHVNS